MFDSFFIVDQNRVLIEKHYLEPISRRIVDDYLQDPKPKIGNYYCISYKPQIELLGLCRKEQDPIQMVSFMRWIYQLMEDYLGPLNELVIKEHFDIVYQLLEEILDHQPLVTEDCILKEMIPPPTFLNQVISAVSVGQNFGTSLPTANTSQVRWRLNGIKYTNNEVFFDVIEHLDCVLDNNHLVCGTIKGKVECLSRLSGMPELVLSLSKKIDPIVCGFHQCVNLNRYLKDSRLSFIPPDGKFQLMEYSLDLDHKQLLFGFKSNLFLNGKTGRLEMSLGPRIHGKQFEYLKLSVVLPHVSGLSSSTNHGQALFDTKTKQLVWEMERLPSDFSTGSPLFVGQLDLTEAQSGSHFQTTTTVHVSFRMNMHSCAGLSIENLLVQSERYNPYKGGRGYVTNGKYHIRLYSLHFRLFWILHLRLCFAFWMLDLTFS
ncbi:Mu homology domain-containing protein [Gorgonomyces haynaldii]|nr:Mu homology domain-containing protein [Gorgonomyces haynaldii]